MKPLINILVRTSNRPNYFRKCMDSILCQDYKKYRIIVCADDLTTLSYVEEYDVDHILVEKLHPSPECSFPYNLYINKLMDMVKEGYILILDDDDFLAHE